MRNILAIVALAASLLSVNVAAADEAQIRAFDEIRLKELETARYAMTYQMTNLVPKHRAARCPFQETDGKKLCERGYDVIIARLTSHLGEIDTLAMAHQMKGGQVKLGIIAKVFGDSYNGEIAETMRRWRELDILFVVKKDALLEKN